ncbi:MAG TPA: hypothetical protein VMY34_04900 [Acidimicrobiales bacterium]|nr:hypothetical protein [Acidimicrobiales bacterium]
MTTATPLGELEQHDEVEVEDMPALVVVRDEQVLARLRLTRPPVVALPDEGTGERAHRRAERHRLRRQQATALGALAAVLLATAAVLISTRAPASAPVRLVRAQSAPDVRGIHVVVVGPSPAPLATLRLLAPARVRAATVASPRPDRTEIRYYDREGEAQARWVRDALGVGTLLFSPRRTEGVDVTVVAGKDLHTE